MGSAGLSASCTGSTGRSWNGGDSAARLPRATGRQRKWRYRLGHSRSDGARRLDCDHCGMRMHPKQPDEWRFRPVCEVRWPLLNARRPPHGTSLERVPSKIGFGTDKVKPEEGEMLNPVDIANFRGALRGELIEPGDSRYAEARQVYNAMISRRPRLIAACADVADVVAALRFGREHSMRVAIRGGGHNAGGLGVCDDGL